MEIKNKQPTPDWLRNVVFNVAVHDAADTLQMFLYETSGFNSPANVA